ncbi:MAG: hypothetical protein JKY33_10355, partial [Bacteroidia bacterium]|nr:hypothetical protein [Bacteroidia bacterium]
MSILKQNINLLKQVCSTLTLVIVISGLFCVITLAQSNTSSSSVDIQLVSAELTTEYSMVPLSQASTTFTGQVKNNGTSTVGKVGVYIKPSGSTFRDTLWISNLAGGETVAFTTTTPFKPGNTGTFSVEISVGTDSTETDNSNNKATTQYEVTDSIYAWDKDVVSGNLGSGPLSGFTNIIYGMVYEVKKEAALTAIAFKLSSGTSLTDVSAAVYFTNASGMPVQEISSSETEVYTLISTSEQWYELSFQNGPVILPPGTYLVGVKEARGDEPIGMTFSTSNFVEKSSYIYADGFDWRRSENFWIGDFYYLVRAIFGEAVIPIGLNNPLDEKVVKVK